MAIEVNARRLLCPMPVIRLQDAANQAPPGSTIIISCTDPGVINDIPAWCRINGHNIIEIDQQYDEITITVVTENAD